MESPNTHLKSRRGLVALVAFLFLLAVIFGLVSGAGASTQSGKERKLNVRHLGETPPILVRAEGGAARPKSS
jgi:hypothetical protein